MRKNILLICSTILLAASCQKSAWLDRVPYTQTCPENFYKNESHFKLATVSAYEAMTTHSIGGYSMSGGTYHQGLPIIMNCPSDELFCFYEAPDNAGQFTQMIKCDFTESNTGLRRMWDAFYAGINRCNETIYFASQNMPENEKVKSYVVECRFLRAFYYWYLAQTFGGVPISCYPSSGTEPRASLEDVYALILEDLDFAYQFLPEETGRGAIGEGSATKYTAAAYIGRICNYLAACKRSGIGADLVQAQPLNDFAWVDAEKMSKKAYDALKDVVENSPYVLIGNFTNLFRETTKADQHKECLLLAENYLSSVENAFPSSAYFGLASQCGGIVENGQTCAVNARYAMPTPMLFGIFSPKDPRRDWFCVGSSDGSVKEGTIKEEVASDGIIYIIPWPGDRKTADYSTETRDDSPTQTYLPFLMPKNAAVGKFRFPQIGQVTTHLQNQHSLSFPLMRFAEVYLMYAEAIYFHLGDEELARQMMRPVLLRACLGDEQLTDTLTSDYHKDDFITELLESRERELCFEGNRKYDLFRFNLIDQTLTDIYTKVIASNANRNYYPWNTYLRFYDRKPIAVTEDYFKACAQSINDNWRHYKIWAPISSLQIAANPNLTQNAEW